MKYASVINWIDVEYACPPKETNVLIVTKNGYVSFGMLAERPVLERNLMTGVYEKTGKYIIEWGHEENNFENWHELDDVVLWAPFPDKFNFE